MSQVKIYALKETIAQHRAALSDAIHHALMQAIQLPSTKKFQRFFALDTEDFIYPADRTEQYVIIEILMFSGRSVSAKKALLKAMMHHIEQATGIAANDIEITLIESAAENWGIRGQHGDELQLNYKVQV